MKENTTVHSLFTGFYCEREPTLADDPEGGHSASGSPSGLQELGVMGHVIRHKGGDEVVAVVITLQE